MSAVKHRITIYIIVAVIAIAAIIVAVSDNRDKAATPAELLSLGEQYLLDLDYENALVQFLKVIEIEPMNERAYTGAAEAYIGLGQTEDALDVLEEGFIVLPDNSEFLLRIDELRLMFDSERETETETETIDETPSEMTTEPTTEPEETTGLLETDVDYYLSNPGYTGRIVFRSDQTFEITAGRHESEYTGVIGIYGIAEPDRYELTAQEQTRIDGTHPYNEKYSAIIKGDRLIVTRASDGYDDIFYIPSGDVVQPDTAVELETIVSSVEILNLREGPGLDYDIMVEITRFQPLSVKGYNNTSEWVFVQYYNLTGWVSAQYLDGLPVLSAPSQGKYVIDATYLDMVGRSYADITYRLGSVESEFMFHGEYYVTSPGSGVQYLFSGDNMNRIAMGLSPEMNDHDVCVKVDAQLGVIVGGFTEQMTLEEFVENLESATEYEMLKSAGTSYYVASEDYAVVHLDNGHYLHINMDRAGGVVSPDSYVWLI